MVAAVRAAGKGSREYRVLRDSLTDLVVGTLFNLDKEGALFRAVFQQCRIRLGPVPADYRSHFRELVYHAAGEAVPNFLDTWVLGGEWDAERGALSTCAVRAGLYAFADEIDLLRRQQRVADLELGSEEAMEYASSESRLRTAPCPQPAPEKTAVERDEIRRHLQAAGPRVARIIRMCADGYTHRDIGKELGMNPEAVSSALRRFRSRFE